MPTDDHVNDCTANSIQDGNGDDDETDQHVPTDDGPYGAGHFIYEDDDAEEGDATLSMEPTSSDEQDMFLPIDPQDRLDDPLLSRHGTMTIWPCIPYFGQATEAMARREAAREEEQRRLQQQQQRFDNINDDLMHCEESVEPAFDFDAEFESPLADSQSI